MENVKLIECMHTWQGEGPNSGVRILLCRVKYCNKECEWCDTLTKMRVTQEADYKLSDLQDQINKYKLGLMVTGGEPTINKHFTDVVNLLNNLEYHIANVETNGFNLIGLINGVNPLKNINYIYSPKIFSEHDLNKEIETTKQIIKHHNIFIKVVYENREIVQKYLEFLRYKLQELNIVGKLWLMPMGNNKKELIKNSFEVFDACEKYNCNFTSRDHIIYNFI